MCSQLGYFLSSKADAAVGRLATVGIMRFVGKLGDYVDLYGSNLQLWGQPCRCYITFPALTPPRLVFLLQLD
jgi:hypothetical protein